MRILGSAMAARGALELLWDACYECGEDYVGTATDIESVVGWTGEPGALTRALLEAGAPEGAGFIEPIEPGSSRYRVHDLWHHAPDYVAKRRKRELERQAKAEPVSAERRRTAPTSDCSPGDDRTPSPSPSPSPGGKSGSSAPPAAREPAELVFPVEGQGAREWGLTASQIREWEGLYPSLDIRAEAQKALAWVKADTGRKKTAGGMPRFLVNWFNRATDRGSRSTPSHTAVAGKTAGNVAAAQRFIERGSR